MKSREERFRSNSLRRRVMITFGEKLSALRRSYGLSQADFGKHIGLSQVMISRLETGKSTVSEKMLCKIIKEFEVL